MPEATKLPVKTEKTAHACLEDHRMGALRQPASRDRPAVRRVPSIRLAPAYGPLHVRFRNAEARRRAWTVAPAMDLVEKEKEYEISAELPGIDEKNVEIKVANHMLTIKGEKKEEKEEKQKDYYLSERRFGSFQRSFALPEGVDADKIEANFVKGVLTVKLPKTAEAQKAEKKITVKAA